MARLTYQRLFAYLKRLGFEESSRSRCERVFAHSRLEILLAFSLPDNVAEDQPVRGADFTSVEYHLQQRGLLCGALADVVEPRGETKAG